MVRTAVGRTRRCGAQSDALPEGGGVLVAGHRVRDVEGVDPPGADATRRRTNRQPKVVAGLDNVAVEAGQLVPQGRPAADRAGKPLGVSVSTAYRRTRPEAWLGSVGWADSTIAGVESASGAVTIDVTNHWPGSTGPPDSEELFPGTASGPASAGLVVAHQPSSPTQDSTTTATSARRLPPSERGAETATSVTDPVSPVSSWSTIPRRPIRKGVGIVSGSPSPVSWADR